MAVVKISVVNRSTIVTDDQVQAAVTAIQTQVRSHFAPAWGLDADLQFETWPPPAGTWWLAILDDSDQADALGYHDVTSEDLPLGKVFVRTTQSLGLDWTVTMSHECLEMLADPDIDLTVLRDTGAPGGLTLYSYEVCDPCEADQFGYKIGDVTVSDFVHPSWFESFHPPNSIQFDYCGRISQPFQLLSGGYVSMLAIAASGAWTQQMASSTPSAYSARPAVRGTRRERRARPRSSWCKSAPIAPATTRALTVSPIAKKLLSQGRGRRPSRLVRAATAAGPTLMIQTSSLAMVSVPDQINKAIDAIASRGSGAAPLPDQDAVTQALRSALDQTAQGRTRDDHLSGAIPDDFQLSLVLSAINGDRGISRPVRALDLFGGGEYETLDPGWIGSLVNRLRSQRVDFPTHELLQVDPIVQIDNNVRIAIAGDWGTGDASSLNIADRIRDLQPDLTIHLGDVYYSGTTDEESTKFVGVWPRGTSKTAPPSFTLNSNHEMYSGGEGYFLNVLNSEQFTGQKGLSYFALTNDNWTIFGLDSAYYAHDFLYQHGNLDSFQLGWMRETARTARLAGKRIILMTHHQGVNLDPDTNTVSFEPIWQQVIDALDGGPDLWYWGHVHAGICFQAIQTTNGKSVQARCIGHGGVPYAPFPDASMLGNSAVKVAWVETEFANDPRELRRALNGFVLVSLSGKNLDEEFHDENGRVRWP